MGLEGWGSTKRYQAWNPGLGASIFYMCFPVIKNMEQVAWEIFLDQVWKWWTAVIFINIPLDETHSYSYPNNTEAETYV